MKETRKNDQNIGQTLPEIGPGLASLITDKINTSVIHIAFGTTRAQCFTLLSWNND
jgi:hypothetical protein